MQTNQSSIFSANIASATAFNTIASIKASRPISKTRAALLSCLVAIISIMASPSAHAQGAYRVGLHNGAVVVGVAVNRADEASASDAAQDSCEAAGVGVTGCANVPTAPEEHFTNACIVIVTATGTITNAATNSGVGIAGDCEAALTAAYAECQPDAACPMDSDNILPLNGDGALFLIDGTATACPADSSNFPTDADAPINCIPALTGLMANDSGTSIELTWTAPAPAEDVTGYRIERVIIPTGALAVPLPFNFDDVPLVTNTGSTQNSYDDMNGLAGTTRYAYRVSAIDSMGRFVLSNTAVIFNSAVGTDPAAPSGLVLSPMPINDTVINLSWNVRRNGGDADINYSLLRAEDAGFTTGTTTVTLTPNDRVTSVTDSGLMPGTTYYYELTATNGGGSGTPTTSSATTLGVLTLTESMPSSDTEIHLNWGLTATGGEAVTYSLERSLMTPGGALETPMQVPLTPDNTATSVTDSGLAAGRTYHYQLTATNRGGMVSTTGTATTLVVAPSGLEFSSLMAINDTEIELIWTVGNDGGDDEISYSLVRSEDASFTTGTATVTLTPNDRVTSVTDSGLMPGTTYYYQVTGRNTGGTSVPSPTGTATTLVLTDPMGLVLTGTATGTATINLSWTLTDTGGQGVTYSLERSSMMSGGALMAPITPLVSGTTATSFNDMGLDPGTTYHYQVTATGDRMGSAMSNIESPMTDAVAPSGLEFSSLMAINDTEIELIWTVGNDGGDDEISYSLVRSEDASFTTGTATVTLTPDDRVTSVTDSGLMPGTTYYYQVTGRNTGGTSVPSPTGTATTLVVAPSGLEFSSLMAISDTEIELIWTVGNDGGDDEISYSLVRSEDASFTTGTATVTLTPNDRVTSVTDSGLMPGTTYYYQVTGRNTGGTSVPSPTGTATTGVVAPSGLTLTGTATGVATIELSWGLTDTGGQTVTYSLERSSMMSGGALMAPITPLVSGTTATSFPDMRLAPGETYHYQVTATGDRMGSAVSAIVTATTDVAAPSGLTLMATATGTTTINLSWGLTDTGGQTVTYSLERSSMMSGGALMVPITPLVSGTTAISFPDMGLAPGETYYYQVTATGDRMGSVMSAIVMATTDAATPSGLTLMATATGTTTINLSWGLTDTGGQTVTYSLERSSMMSGGALMAPITPLVSGTTATSFPDMRLAPGVTYYYQVTATGDRMGSAVSAIVTATTDVAAPDGLTLTAEPRGATEAFLSWELDSNGGEAVTYSLARSLNPDLTGTTAVVLGSNMDIEVTDSGLTTGETYYYQVTATNSMGSELSNIEDVTIGVVQTPRILNKSLLPVIAQATTAMTLCAISNRTNTVLSGCAENKDTFTPADTSKATFAGADTSHALIKRLGQDLSSEQELGDILLRWLGDSSFSHNFSGAGGFGDSGISVWGSGSYKDMEDNDSTLRWDGDVWGASLGADVRINDWLLGTAVSWSSGEFDYTDAETASTGDYDYENFSVHPYVNWAPSGQDYNLWGSVSYGQGDITIQDQAMPNEVSSDTSQYGIAAGINLTLQTNQSEGFRRSVDLRSDFSALWVDIDGAGQAIASETIRTQRFRLLLSGEHDYVVGLHRHLIPGLEVGARYDIGGANNGAGVEVSSSLTYKDLLTGFHLAGQMNALLGAEYDEWGASALLRFGSSVSSRGLSFSLEPTIGRASSDPSRLWQQEASSLADNSSRHGSSSLSAALVSEVAYGMGMHSAFSVPATWQPYANMELGSAIRRYRLGLRYQFVQGLGFRIEGQSLHSSGASTTNSNTGKDYGVQLKTEFEF